MQVGIYGEKGTYFYLLGEQLLNILKKKSITASFIEREEEVDYLILLYKDKERLTEGREKRIYVSEIDEGGSIFLYQKKDQLVRDILKYIIPHGSDDISTIGFLAYEDSVASFSSAYLASHLLGEEGGKVCFLSLNPFFPHEKTFPLTGRGGMSKLLYGIEKKQRVESGLLNFHHQYKFYYLDLPLTPMEMTSFSTAAYEILKEILREEGITYLILDLGIIDRYEIKRWLSVIEKTYYITSQKKGAERMMEENYYRFLEGLPELVECEEDLLLTGKDSILLNPKKKGSKVWKKRLGIKY